MNISLGYANVQKNQLRWLWFDEDNVFVAGEAHPQQQGFELSN